MEKPLLPPAEEHLAGGAAPKIRGFYLREGITFNSSPSSSSPSQPTAPRGHSGPAEGAKPPKPLNPDTHRAPGVGTALPVPQGALTHPDSTQGNAEPGKLSWKKGNQALSPPCPLITATFPLQRSPVAREASNTSGCCHLQAVLSARYIFAWKLFSPSLCHSGGAFVSLLR